MKIIINTATTFKGGGVQVALSFLEECRQFSEHEYHVVLSEKLSETIDLQLFAENFFFYSIGYRPATRVLSIRSHNQYFKDLEKKIKPDVVFTTTGPAYWRPDSPHMVGYNLPHYIYPESPYFSQISILKRIKWRMKGRLLKNFLKKEADAYVVQTEDVNNRLRQWLQTEQVYTVSNTYNHHYINPKKSSQKIPGKKEGEFYFLTLSAWYPHKNLAIITDVINELPEVLKNKVRFVVTLLENDFQKHFPTRNCENLILNVGPVKPEDGPALYKECDALLLPTLLECFSASYAEAMVMKKPIITSDLSFAHTICGNAALYADSEDPADFAKQITNLVENPELLNYLINEGARQVQTFTSAEMRAEEYLNLCKKLADEGKN
jgi:glycosyltransferase involved in cell wall biosynthesis